MSGDSAVLAAKPQGWKITPPEALTTQRLPFYRPWATVGTLVGTS